MKLFTKNVLPLMLSAMWMQPTTFTLTVIASVLVFTARADDRLSQLQTALGSTTIGGFVQSGFTFYPSQDAFGTRNRILWGQHQFELPRFQSLFLTPLPPPSLDENTLFQSSSFVLTLVDTPVQPVAAVSSKSIHHRRVHARSDSRRRGNRVFTVSHCAAARFSNSS